MLGNLHDCTRQYEPMAYHTVAVIEQDGMNFYAIRHVEVTSDYLVQFSLGVTAHKSHSTSANDVLRFEDF
ncbi:MAG: hypothetical protein WC505_02495 [Patescibacteria group bacterium]